MTGIVTVKVSETDTNVTILDKILDAGGIVNEGNHKTELLSSQQHCRLSISRMLRIH